MFYSYNITVLSTTTEAAPKEQTLYLAAGIIHQIDLAFPSTSDKDLYARIFHGGYQLVPTNAGEAIRADDTIISTREFYELTAELNELTVRAWNTHASASLLLSINIGLLPKKILQPFSFEELLKAALGTEP